MKLLSIQEERVVHEICDGKTNREIAEVFGISDQTVKNHLTSMYRKTRTSNRTALALWYERNGAGESGKVLDEHKELAANPTPSIVMRTVGLRCACCGALVSLACSYGLGSEFVSYTNDCS